MCDKNVDPMTITIATDPESEFKALMELMRDSGQEKPEDDDGEVEA